jgi:hypothetical protein
MAKSVKLPLTPITEETFKRQGWIQRLAGDYDTLDEMDEVESDDVPHFWTLPIPKDRVDKYAPMFISNDSDALLELKSMGLKPGQYFVEIMDFDGLGFCTTEEQLELLYKLLTGKSIEQ